MMCKSLLFFSQEKKKYYVMNWLHFTHNQPKPPLSPIHPRPTANILCFVKGFVILLINVSVVCGCHANPNYPVKSHGQRG